MTLYVVIDDFESSFCGVFSSQERAQKYIDESKARFISVKEVELDKGEEI